VTDSGGSRRAALLRFGLRALTAAFFLLAALLLAGQFLRTADWEATLGTVERAAIATAATSGDSQAPGERFQPAVRYRYRVDDQEYEGTAIGVFDWIYPSRDRAAAYLAVHGIEAGTRIPVYYNPEDAAESVLVRDIPWQRLEVILAMLFLVMLPVAVVVFSAVDLVRGGGSRRGDRSRGRFW